MRLRLRLRLLLLLLLLLMLLLLVLVLLDSVLRALSYALITVVRCLAASAACNVSADAALLCC